MRKKLLFLALCIGTVATAQEHQHEFLGGVGGGFSSLQFSPGVGSQNIGFGSELGLGYAYFFTPEWSARTGLNVAFYNSSATASNISGSNNAVTPSGADAFRFNYTYNSYEDKLSATLLTIPIMAQYHRPIQDNFTAYASLGFKLGFPISAKHTTSGDITTTGYFEDIDVTYHDLPEYGFSTSNFNQKSDLDLKMAFMLAFEAGVKYKIDNQWSIYGGLYFDYSLNNISNESGAPTANYKVPTPVTTGSLVGSADRLAPLAFGLTVRACFGYQDVAVNSKKSSGRSSSKATSSKNKSAAPNWKSNNKAKPAGNKSKPAEKP